MRIGKMGFFRTTVVRAAWALGAAMNTAVRHPGYTAASFLAAAAPVIPACGSAELGATEDGAFAKLLQGEGIDLGDHTINISTNEAASQTVTMEIPIDIQQGYGEGIMNLALMVRLSTDFADFPISLTGWELTVDGRSFSNGKPKTFASGKKFEEQLLTGGAGTEALLDLPRELNWSGVIWPTTLKVQLRADTSGANKWVDYAIPFHAVLQGAKD